MSFHRSRIVQLWSEWCLYDVLQEAINRELEDEKVSNGSREKNWFSTGCFPCCCFLIESIRFVSFGSSWSFGYNGQDYTALRFIPFSPLLPQKTSLRSFSFYVRITRLCRPNPHVERNSAFRYRQRWLHSALLHSANTTANSNDNNNREKNLTLSWLFSLPLHLLQ